MSEVWTVLAESRSGLRWHSARVWSGLVYPRSFAGFGAGSVIVRPNRLRNTRRISVGSNCAIHEDSWLQAEGPESWLEIGDDGYLGLRVHLHAADRIEIGPRCMFADDVLVNDSEHVPGHLNAVRSRGRIRIGADVFLGVRSVVLGGVTIGDGAVVGAASVVTRDVPAGAVVAGAPARLLAHRSATTGPS